MITEQQVVVTSVLVALVGLIAFTIGLWVGYGREREYVAELEDALDQQQREALGVMPPEIAHEVDLAVARHPAGKRQLPEVAYEEPWPVHVDQALAVARQDDEDTAPPLEPTVVIPPDPPASVTAWTKAMAADMDQFIAAQIEQTDQLLREMTR